MSSSDPDRVPLLLSKIPENPIILPSTNTQERQLPRTTPPPSGGVGVGVGGTAGSNQPGPSPTGSVKSNSKMVKSSKIGLQRTSRTSQKLKLLPEDPDLDNSTLDDDDEEDDDKPTRVYSQVKKITDTTARKDAETLNKLHRDLLPRVTAYCTCGSYKMKELLRWLKDKKKIHNTSPKMFDECIYTPFTYKDWRHGSSNSSGSASTSTDEEDKRKLIC